jgi:hypothetical protein
MPGTHKKAEPVTPHFLSLNQDIVGWPQEVKCGLKYVIHSLRAEFGLQIKTIKKGRAIADPAMYY